MSDSPAPSDDPFDFIPAPDMGASGAFWDFAPAPEPDSSHDPFAFTPVHVKARHDGWSPDRQRAFIAALASHGGVSEAARMVGMTRQSANRLCKRPGAEEFAGAWDAALAEGRLRSWDAAMERINGGYLVPIRRRGEVVGYRHRSDTRLMFAAIRHLLPQHPDGG